MRKKTKQLVFFGAVLVFIIISFAVVIFALGYQYDFIENKFLKTGSIEIKVNVPADVYINEEFAGDTSFLGNYFSKGRLLPRTYNVRVENEKYETWHKLAKIEAGFLTNFPKVVLLAENLPEEVVASSSISNLTIKRFDSAEMLAVWGNRQKLEMVSLLSGERKPFKPTLTPTPAKSAISPDENEKGYSIAPDNNKKLMFNEREIWIEWIKDSTSQPIKLAGDTELVTRFSQKVEDVQWYKDSEHLIASVGGILKFIEIDTRGGLNIFDITTIGEPFYYDRNMDAVFKFEGNKLVRINLSE